MDKVWRFEFRVASARLRRSSSTISGPVESTLIEKKSRFIARLRPVTSALTARELVEDARLSDSKACHHGWAYKLANGETRCSDDGEPSGTAGRPILGALENAGITNIAACVTRYYGGIKLGTGGLARAYGGAAQLAVVGSKIVPIHEEVVLEAVHTNTGIDHGLIYQVIASVEAQQSVNSGKIVRMNEDYNEDGSLHTTRWHTPDHMVNAFVVGIQQASKGAIVTQVIRN